jgi:ribose/xylose/arabinose/galactoside ABC-type transport system permease subunit
MIGEFINRNRRPISAFGVLVVLLTAFTIANPKVFLNIQLYTAVFTSLPLSIVLAVPLVFVIAAGEIDLAFPSVVGVAAWACALVIQAGWSPAIGILAALGAGALAGLVNGLLVTRAKLSSLVSTLGMNFFLRGLINLGTQGQGIPLTKQLADTSFRSIFAGELGPMPTQMLWAIAFAVVGVLLFNSHRLGAQACCVGDNQESAREMGISVEGVRTMAFVYVGIASGLVGILSNALNLIFWPTTGDGFLLSTLAAVFVGGTPTWGGVGTVTGAVIGTFTVGFVSTGIIAAGLTGFWTQFFYGLVIILSLLGHRFNQPRYR